MTTIDRFYVCRYNNLDGYSDKFSFWAWAGLDESSGYPYPVGKTPIDSYVYRWRDLTKALDYIRMFPKLDLYSVDVVSTELPNGEINIRVNANGVTK